VHPHCKGSEIRKRMAPSRKPSAFGSGSALGRWGTFVPPIPFGIPCRFRTSAHVPGTRTGQPIRWPPTPTFDHRRLTRMSDLPKRSSSSRTGRLNRNANEPAGCGLLPSRAHSAFPSRLGADVLCDRCDSRAGLRAHPPSNQERFAGSPARLPPNDSIEGWVRVRGPYTTRDTHARRPSGLAVSTRPTHPTPTCRGGADPPEHGKIFALALHTTQAIGGRLAIRDRCRSTAPVPPPPSICRPVASSSTVRRRTPIDRASCPLPEIRTHVEQSRRQYHQLRDARRPC
jgi:hypothetical protein